MDIKTLRAEAKMPMQDFCRMCPVCDGKACAGQVPGMGGAITGSSFTANAEALRETRINLRVVHGTFDPSTKYSFLGNALSTPIMAAPMTGAKFNCGTGLDEHDFVKAIVEGATAAGSIGWIGDTANWDMFEAGLTAASEVGRFIAIIKPRKDPAEITKRFEHAKEKGAVAVGIDLDGAGLVTMRLNNQAVSPKTAEELKKLKAAAGLPFIVKGIMTEDEAILCAEAGVDCIVVSNHGGRVLDGCPGVAEVLPEIAYALGGSKVTILADGAVRSGVDALKLMALGAEGVLIGRPLCWGAFGGGAEGVETFIKTYTNQLYQAMIMTGCSDLSAVNERVIF